MRTVPRIQGKGNAARLGPADSGAATRARYARGDGQPGLVRWGHQRGSVYAADQKLPVPAAFGLSASSVLRRTENRRVCAAFLRSLVERGFTGGNGLLLVLDGAKGLRAAVAEVSVTTTNMLESIMAQVEQRTELITGGRATRRSGGVPPRCS